MRSDIDKVLPHLTRRPPRPSSRGSHACDDGIGCPGLCRKRDIEDLSPYDLIYRRSHSRILCDAASNDEDRKDGSCNLYKSDSRRVRPIMKREDELKQRVSRSSNSQTKR